MANQISLVNMSDLLSFVKSTVNDAPVTEVSQGLSAIVTARKNLGIAPDGFISESDKSKAARDAVSKNIQATTHRLAERHLKKLLLTHLNEYVNSDFLTPVISSEDEYITEQMASGIKFYKFHADKIPSELMQNIQKSIGVLNERATEYINKQLSQDGEFVMDSRYLEKEFPNFKTIIQSSDKKNRWDLTKIKEKIKHLPQKPQITINRPQIEND